MPSHKPGDLVVDPAAGGFAVMHVATEMGRRFVGCDIAHHKEDRKPPPARIKKGPPRRLATESRGQSPNQNRSQIMADETSKPKLAGVAEELDEDEDPIQKTSS